MTDLIDKNEAALSAHEAVCAERNVDIPSSVATYRASIVAKADELETAISAVTSVEQLIALDLSFPSETV
jgi:hypothetical protein